MNFRDFKLSEKIDNNHTEIKAYFRKQSSSDGTVLPKRYEAQSSSPNAEHIQFGSSWLDYNRFCLKNGGQKASTGIHNGIFLLFQIHRVKAADKHRQYGKRVLHLKNMTFIPVQDAKKRL